ncbi:uclacyanin 1-like [Malania oleifera]|uniref:uclacyanin 1-like n=1 Tax=Malania oleifera TaxID=397392 RepID=UPI0025AE70D7|nr:uclacyanin 1-like [Malania oleifera]
MQGLRPAWAVKAIMVIIIASIFFRCVSAANHTVGGSTGWDLTSNIPAWAASSTFHAGDYLVFRYVPIHDVLEVDQLDYATCRTVDPISAYDDGETVVELSEVGTRFFICGRRRHCAMGLRLRVQVLPSLAQAPNANATTGNGTRSSNGTAPQGGVGNGSRISPPSPSTRSPSQPAASPRGSLAPPSQQDDGDNDDGGCDRDRSGGSCNGAHSSTAEVGCLWVLVVWLSLTHLGAVLDCGSRNNNVLIF